MYTTLYFDNDMEENNKFMSNNKKLKIIYGIIN